MRFARRETGLSPLLFFFTDRFKVVLLLWIIYVVSVLFLLCFRARLFIDALWSPAGNGLTSWLSFVMSKYEVVAYPIGIMGQVWCLIVSIPDLCPLAYKGKHFEMFSSRLKLKNKLLKSGFPKGAIVA